MVMSIEWTTYPLLATGIPRLLVKTAQLFTKQPLTHLSVITSQLETLGKQERAEFAGPNYLVEIQDTLNDLRVFRRNLASCQRQETIVESLCNLVVPRVIDGCCFC